MIRTRPILSHALFGVLMVFYATASAGQGIAPFAQDTFDRLTKAGEPVVIVVHADWCPTCKAQLPIQTTLMAEPEFAKYTMLKLDFDTDKALLKTFKVIKQSTIIVFRGTTEVGRSIGDTNKESIAALLRQAAK